jgi:hypothetical protein
MNKDILKKINALGELITSDKARLITKDNDPCDVIMGSGESHHNRVINSIDDNDKTATNSFRVYSLMYDGEYKAIVYVMFDTWEYYILTDKPKSIARMFNNIAVKFTKELRRFHSIGLDYDGQYLTT